MYCFLDLETTGLNPGGRPGPRDAILEIASIITDDDLGKIARYERVVGLPMLPPGSRWWPDEVQQMHEQSGLWEACAAWFASVHASGVFSSSIGAVMVDFARWISARRPGDEKMKLAGNCVWFDREFLRVARPDLDAEFSHRMLDLSALNLLAEATSPELHAARPASRGRHRAMPDCEDSLALARYYRSARLVGQQDAALTLTKDERVILRYLLGELEILGEPLKDTYQLGEDEPADKDAVMASLLRKLYTIC
jgi:oligoribonuclease (3'-5' exoribonuclease)